MIFTSINLKQVVLEICANMPVVFHITCLILTKFEMA
jgi:hypothetical protein